MLELTDKTMAGAIKRAKAGRMKVRVLSVDNRTFAVTNLDNSKTYTVRFAIANGHRLGECDCAARTVCKHLASAASLNIAVQSGRELNPTAAESQAFLSRNVGWML